MTTTKKITKKDQYTTLLNVLNSVSDTYSFPEGITYDDMVAFVTHEMELLDNKAAAAQKRAAAKKEEGDALREEVYGVLSDTEFMTIDQILAAVSAVSEADVRRNMVTSRLTQLAHLDRVERDTVSVGDEGKTHKVSAYRRK